MSWKWYGVKTAFRTTVSGKPTSPDEDFDSDATLVEERVVLVRARNFDEAIAKSEAKAQSYATAKHKNSYGQTVRTRYLGAIDAFELFDDPAAGTEVFSRMEVIPAEVSDKEVIDHCFGTMKGNSASTRKFLNTELPE